MWHRPAVSGALPPTRRGHSATFVPPSTLLVFGGNDGDLFYNDLWKLDLERYRWTRCENVGGPWPTSRRGHTATLVGNRLVVFGGRGNDEDLFNDIYILHTDTLQWSQPTVTGDIPAPRYGHSVILTGELYSRTGAFLAIFGGCGDAIYNDLFSLDLDTFYWTNFSQGLDAGSYWPEGRVGHTADLVDGKMIVFGGAGMGGFFNEVLLLALDSGTPVWTRPDMSMSVTPPPAPRRAHTSTRIGHTILVFGGGIGTESFSDIHILDTVTTSWVRSLTDSTSGSIESSTEEKPSYRWGHSSTLVKSSLVIFGGGQKEPSYASFNDLFLLELPSLTPLLPISILAPPTSSLSTVHPGVAQPSIKENDIALRSKDGHLVWTNKATLKERCPHFAVLLLSGMRESMSDVIDLKESTPVVTAFVTFLNSNSLNFIDDQSCAPSSPITVCLDLLRLSDMYFLDRLKWCVNLRIRALLSVTNATEVIEWGVVLGADDLVDTALRILYGVSNLSDLIPLNTLAQVRWEGRVLLREALKVTRVVVTSSSSQHSNI
mmetsp:Transcript_14214/g.23511  ORF Transcript_14214/g.23511 Transcript_14214/m.23511 type:complete len:545 (+) Transcript_14214:139-1773(+)